MLSVYRRRRRCVGGGVRRKPASRGRTHCVCTYTRNNADRPRPPPNVRRVVGYVVAVAVVVALNGHDRCVFFSFFFYIIIIITIIPSRRGRQTGLLTRADTLKYAAVYTYHT